MIDRYTNVIFGWKITDENASKLEDELESLDEEWFCRGENFFIIDHMSGNYIYFGALLGRFNEHEDDGEILIDDKLVKKTVNAYHKFLKENKDIDNVIKKYAKRKKPQLYVMQQTY